MGQESGWICSVDRPINVPTEAITGFSMLLMPLNGKPALGAEKLLAYIKCSARPTGRTRSKKH